MGPIGARWQLIDCDGQCWQSGKGREKTSKEKSRYTSLGCFHDDGDACTLNCKKMKRWCSSTWCEVGQSTFKIYGRVNHKQSDDSWIGEANGSKRVMKRREKNVTVRA